jgi:hypothetical protein
MTISSGSRNSVVKEETTPVAVVVVVVVLLFSIVGKFILTYSQRG